jgi:hypothetical protein
MPNIILTVQLQIVALNFLARLAIAKRIVRLRKLLQTHAYLKDIQLFDIF